MKLYTCIVDFEILLKHRRSELNAVREVAQADIELDLYAFGSIG